ncbi:MAG: hypothetical protein HKN62_14230 [Phycisphaerales bacterium]|nr:hypothetical protein [Phycisphaerales bacterium]
MRVRNPIARRLAFTALKSRWLRAPLTWWRERGVTPADVVVASYPRSGNTWVRFLLYDLLTGDEPQFRAVGHGVPEIGRHRDTEAAVLADGGRILKTHEPYRPAYRRAVYVVRDPRDVVVSEYWYQRWRNLYEGPLDAFVDRFLRGRVNTLVRWDRHVTGYLDASIDLHLVRYAALHEDGERTLADLCRFLGLETTPAEHRRALERSAFERMRAKEDRMRRRSPTSRIGDRRMIRRGRAGGWREELDPADAERIETAFGATMNRVKLA